MAVSSLRAADADREQVADRLRRAHDEGRISLLEFDERLAAAYAARTYDELGSLTADLPPVQTRRVEPSATRSARPGGIGYSGRRRSRGGWRVARRVQFAALVLAGVVNLVIWLAVSIGTASIVYPWWIWVVGPWGLALAAESVVARMLARSSSTA
jgi:hypothetical protein